MTVEQIKALPRTGEGIFDLSSMGGNPYKAATEIYPVYAEFETNENKKEGYPDIMAQMRLWNQKVKAEFTFENVANYIAMLYDTIENISPEIYENYKELVDMFREAVKAVLAQFYCTQTEDFCEEAAGTEELELFCETVRRACAAYLLLAEKYEMCF